MIRAIVAIFILVFGLSSTLFAQSHGLSSVSILANDLDTQHRIEHSWSNIVEQNATLLAHNTAALAEICPENSPCAKGPYSLANELAGLQTILKANQTEIVACNHETVACVLAHDQTHMARETVSQLHFVLQTFLTQRTLVVK